MTVQSPGTVACILSNTYGTREFEKALDWIAEDAEISVAATGERFQGPDGYLQQSLAWAAAFPDLRVEIHQISAGSDSAVVEYTLRGTHTGPMMNRSAFIPPTSAQLELRVCDVIQMRDGKVVRIMSYFDSGTMLRQMGLLSNSPFHPSERRMALGLYATEVDASIEQRNKAIVHRFLEEVVNQRNPTAAAITCSPDLIWHAGSIGAKDLPAFQSVLASLFSSFPDLHLEVHDIIAESDRVAVRVTVRGTQLGEFQGIPPTGKRISSSGINSYRIANDRIVEEWWHHDLLAVMRQLDALQEIWSGER